MKNIRLKLPLALLTLLVFLLSVSSVWAQSIPKTSTNLSGTIATTGTFQQIQGQANGRQGCVVQDTTSSDQMWVYFGTCSGATESTSVTLWPGQSVNCNLRGSNIVLSDPVCITGTSGDSFFANFQ